MRITIVDKIDMAKKFHNTVMHLFYVIICVMNRFSDNFMIMMLIFGCVSAHTRKKSVGIRTKSVNGP